MLPEILTLNLNSDFRRLYARGKSYANPALVTYVMKNRAGICHNSRMGITTSKKIGNAVKRNRARRIISAAFRQLEPQIGTGWDIVFVARVRTTALKSTDVLRVMEMQLKTAGVLK